MDDHDILVIEVARRGTTGGNVDTVDWTTIRADVDGLLLNPAINALTDVPDVTGTPVAGDVLVYDGTTWVTQDPAPAMTVTDTGSVDLTLDGSDLSADVIYAGSGSESTASRSDHTHANHAPTRETFTPGGYLSSGTRPLASTTVALTPGVSHVVKARLNMQVRGADPGACYYRLTVTINGNARQSGSATDGFWCVQGVPDKTTWEHHQTITGTGAAITVSASIAYDSGGGFYTDAGELVIERIAER